MGPKHLLLLGAVLMAGCQDNAEQTTTSHRDRGTMSDGRGAGGKGGEAPIVEITPDRDAKTSMAADKLAQPGALSTRDQKFVVNAASGGLFEVQSSQLAVERAKDPAVKQFAQQMVNDHTRVNDELASLVSGKGGAVPTMLAPRHQLMLSTLSKTGADDFDAAYLRAQSQAHDEAITLFEEASNALDDAALKAFATKTTPALESHKKMLQNMGKPMKGHGGM